MNSGDLILGVVQRALRFTAVWGWFEMADLQPGRSTRRQFLKGAVATGAGVTAAAYVKPSLRSLGIPGALAQISGAPAEETPVDSSVSVSTDDPGSTLPLLPSTGGGGMSSSSVASTTAGESNDNSRLPELIAVAVAGGLLGRRAVQMLRDQQDADATSMTPDAPIS
jgi:hypothetical protein